jgi:LmbE family N-acetylglucosaminyl deacetylase
VKTLSVLAFGAHPDDIEILCSGTLAKYRKLGHRIGMAVVTSGGAGHPTMPPAEISAIRREEALASSQVIGAQLYWLGIEDQFLFDDRETRVAFIDVIRTCRPNVVLCPYPQDYHHDHRMVSELVFKTIVAACLPGVVTKNRALESLPVLYYYDTVNGIDFIPEEYVDITEFIDVKKQMLSKHESQLSAMKELIRTDLMETLEVNARYRGQQCNARYAEGFRRAGSHLLMSAQRVLP